MTSPPSDPRFSIIVPTYNRQGLLLRCVQSIRAQTFGRFEAVVVDDGSTDGTAEMMARIVQSDARIKYVPRPHEGANAARNYGANLATGEYLLFLDSDDEATEPWLAELDQLIAESQAEVACCGIDFFDGQGRHLGTRRPTEDRAVAGQGGLFLSGTFAIRKTVLAEIGGWDSNLSAHHMTDLRLRLSEVASDGGYRVASIGRSLVRAHSHDGPKIRRDAKAKLEATEYILKRHGEKFADRRDLAVWFASAGGCAAELGDYRRARRYFARAVRVHPWHWKNYARIVLCSLPGVRRCFWNDTGRLRLSSTTSVPNADSTPASRTACMQTGGARPVADVSDG